MRKIQKAISILMALVLCFGTASVCASAGWFGKKTQEQPPVEEKEKLEVINIFVEGINTDDVVNVKTGKKIFPPEANDIINAVMAVAPDYLKAEIGNDDEAVIQAIVDGVMSVCSDMAMDENGDPKPESESDTRWPSVKDIKQVAYAGNENHRICYSYDWRLGMKTIAEGLHGFIKYVMKAADVKKVNLIGFSMGAATVLSYLKLYEDEYLEYVNGVVLLAPGCNGSSSCGEPFAKKVDIYKDVLVNYVDSILGYSLGSVILDALTHTIATLSLSDTVIDWLNGKIDSYIDGVYEGMFMQTFGTMPGLWSLVPDKDYEAARKNVPEGMSEKFIDAIDWYHTNVSLNKDSIIGGIYENGLRFGIIAKYGYPITPVIESGYTMSDSVIDTVYESFGATCADIGSTLGEAYVQQVDNGHNCLSPDGLIDSSTCKYCDQTWFIKNSAHSEDLDPAMELLTFILFSEEQPDVWNDEFPQYLTVDGIHAVPLTKDNDKNLYSGDISGESILTILPKFFKDLIGYILFWFKSTILGVFQK